MPGRRAGPVLQALQKAEERASTLEMQSRSQVGSRRSAEGGPDAQAEGEDHDLATRFKLQQVGSEHRLMLRS